MGAPVFKTGEGRYPVLAGSIPVRLRHLAALRRSASWATDLPPLRLFQQAGDPREALAAVQLAQARTALADPSGAPLLDAHESFLLEFETLSGAHELVTTAAVCWMWLEDYDRAERLLRRTITTARGATALRALPLRSLRQLSSRSGEPAAEPDEHRRCHART